MLEFFINVPGWHVAATDVTPDGACRITLAKETPQEWGFRKISLAGVSMSSPGMDYEPEDPYECALKMEIQNTIASGEPDFWATPKHLHEEERRFTFVEKTRYWGGCFQYFVDLAKKICPENESCLGTDKQLAAFLAVQIIEDCAEGMEPKKAWEKAASFKTNAILAMNAKNGNGLLSATNSAMRDDNWTEIPKGSMQDMRIMYCHPWVVLKK